MADATLDDIESALYTALSAITKPASNAPFVSLTRYAGDVSKSEGVAQEILQRTPAALIAFDGERGQNDEELLEGDAETVGRSTWTILVVSTDVRGTGTGLKGARGTPGIYALASAAQAALNNLAIDGLLRNERLRYQGTLPVLMQRGKVYVLAVRFTADRVLPDAVLTDTSVAYLGITAKEHLIEAPGAPDPIDGFVTP